MNAYELIHRAQSIAANFVEHESNMNIEIAKMAMSTRMNDEQISRMVEECNKAAFLLMLERKGKQVFDVASFEGVKEYMKPEEKKPVEHFENIKMEDHPVMDEVNRYLASKKSIEKKAECEVLSEEYAKICINGFEKMAQYIELIKLASEYEEIGHRRLGYNYSGYDLVKVAEQNKYVNFNKLAEILDEKPKLEDEAIGLLSDIFTHEEAPILVKNASFIWGNENPFKSGISAIERVGSVANAAAHVGIGVPLKVASKTVKPIIKGSLAAATALAPATAILGNSPLQKVFNVMMLKHEGSKALDMAKGTGMLGSRMIGPGVEMIKSASTMEKCAFFGALLGLAKPMLPAIADAAGTAMTKAAPSLLGSALKVGGKAAMMGQQVLGAKPFQALPNVSSGILKSAEDSSTPDPMIEKLAGWREGLQHVLDFVLPTATMGWGGIAATAAKKLGGGIALTMNKKELEQSFDTIVKQNPEFAGKEEVARKYFDVIARNAPSLASDPMIAGNLVKNFDALGGVDFNTVKSLRETEQIGQGGSDSRGLAGLLPIKI